MWDEIKQIAEHYGFESQSRQLIEEMAELTVAINKYHRAMEYFRNDDKSKPCQFPLTEFENVAEEMADTIIMLEQAKHLLGISGELIDRYIQEKINRQLERMAKE